MRQAIQYLTAVGAAAGVLMSQGVVAGDSVTATHDIGITISEVALINVANETISFVVNEPADAGAIPSITGGTDGATRLRYTSIVQDGETRTITVQHDGTVPDGLALQLSVGADADNGAGALGSSAMTAATTVTDLLQDAVTGIGSGYTGDGAEDGRLLTYSLSITEADQLKANEMATDVTVTYTLTGGSGN